jgi:hypothetical protein
MAIQWQFSSDDYTEKTFSVIPVGEHRVRIASAEEQTSSKGKQMIKLDLEVSGYNSTIWHYLVFLPDNAKLTNQKLGELWNSFDIPQGNFNLQQWVGKVGAAKVKHEDYEGTPQPRIAYFIAKNRQESLPAWAEPSNGNKASTTNWETVSPEDELPWH